MVAIFIDESGNFTPSTPYSAAAALTVPHNRLARIRAKLSRLTARWPQVDGELKGGQLSTDHVAALVDVPFKQHVVLHFTVTSVAAHDGPEIDDHKLKQCELMTTNLTPQHHPDLVAQV